MNMNQGLSSEQLNRENFEKASFFKKYRSILICSVLTLIYAVLIFANLGNVQSAQTLFRGNGGSSIVVDFGEERHLGMFQYMLGPSEEQRFTLEFSFDNEYWHEPFELFIDPAFMWDYMPFDGGAARFARITAQTDGFYFMEMAFRDNNLNIIPVSVISEVGHELFDEQHLVPQQPRDFMHSSMFDEVFYPRAAYEYVHHMDVNERTHPPLGKVIISWGIELFGMTPFGWRVMTALAGIALIPFMYFFALALFKKDFWASIATVIFAADFMHFVQSRIATLDVLVTLFMVAMFYFMYRYSQSKSLAALMFSGVFMGLAIATKWSGLYGAVGLAIAFLYIYIKRCKEEGRFGYQTLLYSVGFFVAVPAVIYVISYIPYYNTGYLYPDYGFLAAVVQSQFDMADFHIGFVAYHPYISPWWEWLINWRPVLYFANTLPSGLVQGISTFGNPLVWWGGLLALGYTAFRAIKKDFVPMFLMLGYLSQLLPWVLASREVQFIYYYYPNVAFLALMLAYAIKEASVFDKVRINRKVFACIFAALCMGLFVLFYPVLAGVPIDPAFAERFLIWPFMNEWILVVS
ncbi:MAG: phospholipid carrier-dependent glycosyltransferase [Coriobacteriia bacterium]|nr:phospholipid carrier-dependent glycosyltransferase [Coriobacteriia bacterium]